MVPHMTLDRSNKMTYRARREAQAYFPEGIVWRIVASAQRSAHAPSIFVVDEHRQAEQAPDFLPIRGLAADAALWRAMVVVA